MVAGPLAVPLLTIHRPDLALAAGSANTRPPTSFSASALAVSYGGLVVGVQAVSASNGTAIAPTATSRRRLRGPACSWFIPCLIGARTKRLHQPICSI